MSGDAARMMLANVLMRRPQQPDQADFLRSEKDTRPYEDTYTRGNILPVGVSGYTGKPEFARNVPHQWLADKLTPDPSVSITDGLKERVFESMFLPLTATEQIKASAWNGVNAPRNALSGNIPQWEYDPRTGETHTSEAMDHAGMDAAGLAATGGFAVPRRAAVQAAANTSEANAPSMAVQAGRSTPLEMRVAKPIKTSPLKDFPEQPPRPYEADYAPPRREDVGTPLAETMDGTPISARYVAGRRTVGGPDQGLTGAEIESVGRALAHNGFGPMGVFDSIFGNKAGVLEVGRTRGGRQTRDLQWARFLEEPHRSRVIAHETGHAIDFGGEGAGLTADGRLIPQTNTALHRNSLDVYHTGRTGAPPARVGDMITPLDVGYPLSVAPYELNAETIRAYMTNPNYLKTVAPDVAAHIRDRINSTPGLKHLIQFNANTTEASAPSLAAQAGREKTVSPEVESILERHGLIAPKMTRRGLLPGEDK